MANMMKLSNLILNTYISTSFTFTFVTLKDFLQRKRASCFCFSSLAKRCRAQTDMNVRKFRSDLLHYQLSSLLHPQYTLKYTTLTPCSLERVMVTLNGPWGEKTTALKGYLYAACCPTGSDYWYEGSNKIHLYH